MKEKIQICSRGVWDTSIPGILFDENGVSNYAHLFDKLVETYPRAKKGKCTGIKLFKELKKKAEIESIIA